MTRSQRLRLGIGITVVSVLSLVGYAQFSGEPQRGPKLALRLSGDTLELALPKCLNAGDVIVTAPTSNKLSSQDSVLWKAAFQSPRTLVATSDPTLAPSEPWNTSAFRLAQRLVVTVTGTPQDSATRDTFSAIVDVKALRDSQAIVAGRSAASADFEAFAGKCS